MNARGILRKSPTKKRNVTTRLADAKQKNKTVQIVTHNRCKDENDVVADSMVTARNEMITMTKQRYSAPEKYSVKILENNLEKLKINGSKAITDINQLTPRTKNIVTEPALKKLNIPAEKVLYKHLPPVNVNDSVLEVRFNPRTARVKKEFAPSKHPMPNLTDYLKPMKQLSHQLTQDDLDISDDERLVCNLANNNFRNTYESYQKHFMEDSMEKLM